MASITERDGRFLVRVRRRGHPTLTRTFTRRSDAAAWARRTEVDLEAGRLTPNKPPVPTLREAVQEYRRVIAPGMKGANSYRYRYDEFEALDIARQPIDAVRPDAIARWRDEQLKRLKPGTVVRKLAMLSSIFSWAARERGWLTQNPMSLVRKPRSADARDRILSPDELTWLMMAARSSKAAWLAPALTVLLWSAMRRGELFGLRRADVDFEKATAHLADTKNGSARDVPLCPRALEAMRELDRAAQMRNVQRLIPLGSQGSVSTRFVAIVRRARTAYLRKCESEGKPAAPGFLEGIRLHDLRHHAVTTWASSNALSLPELMTISGHKSLKMLTRYTHIQSARLASKLAALEPELPAALTGQRTN